ncbi:SIMPL domain-containing protein, partial [Nocardia brasiliensis]|uniref:SIMPL domain-containing protein n=1 Tax=Nocardia brasiliensis TaxID=37326 RepID=UPI0024567E86
SAGGGKEPGLGGVFFAIDENALRWPVARPRGFADAKARAEQYAVLAGVQLSGVITISEASDRDESPKYSARDAAPQSVPLEPGTQTVTFTVKVTWGLR